MDPAARDKYLLQVTAGPTYDLSTHREVAVNGPDAFAIENDYMTCWLRVRIRDYHGLPKGSPSTSSYFDHPLHKNDRNSIGFSFVPKKDIPGEELVTGFDFDHSVRDRLPPGFRYAMKIVTSILDPGIYADPYSDKPYLYGPALSSFFSFRIKEHTQTIPAEKQLESYLEESSAGVIEEGADGSGVQIQKQHAIPSKSSKRRRSFLNTKNIQNSTFEAGRLYQGDFFNPYLDFANFSVRLPGISISVAKYIDDKTHQLRYVLKNRRTEEILFVVIFTLLFGQKLEDELANREDQEKTEAPRSRSRTPETRPETSSSYETPTPSSRNSSAADSDTEESNQDNAAAQTWAGSIYSGLAAFGFGRTASSSESSSRSSSKGSSPDRKTMDQRVDQMDPAIVEEYLKDRHSSV